MEHQTFGRWAIWSIAPATQRIILKIDWFLMYQFLLWDKICENWEKILPLEYIVQYFSGCKVIYFGDKEYVCLETFYTSTWNFGLTINKLWKQKIFLAPMETVSHPKRLTYHSITWLDLRYKLPSVIPGLDRRKKKCLLIFF